MPKQSLYLLVACISLGLVVRIIPHVPNVSPLIPLALIFGQRYRLPIGILAVTFILVTSSLMLGYTIFSFSMFFMLASYAMILLLGRHLNRGWFFNGIIASLIFWVMTNFGVWLISGMYPASCEGFIRCYYLALPFLRNTLVGNVLWGWVLHELCQIERSADPAGFVSSV